MVAWRRLLDLVPKHLISRKNETELSLEIKGQWLYELKGTENRDSLRGGGPSAAAFDEYAYCDPWAWEEVVQPALSDKMGRCMFGSTPRGHEHFYNLAQMESLGHEGWKTWHVPTSEAGTVSAAELARIRLTMASDFYRQEYLAEFLGHVGLLVPEFIPRDWPDGNILPMHMWPSLAKSGGVFWGSGDYGKGPKTEFHWHGGFPGDRMVTFWEYTGASLQLPSLLAQELNALDQRLLGKKTWKALDPACWNVPRPGVRSTADVLSGAGVKLRKADNDFEASILQWRELCKSREDEEGRPVMPRYMILAGTCPNLQHQICTLSEDPEAVRLGRSGEQRLRRGTVHDAFDSGRYGIMFRRKAPEVERMIAGDGRPRIVEDSEHEGRAVTGIPD
jgi:hypothetical protein